MTDIAERLRSPQDGWTGDAVCVDADVAAEGAAEIERLRAALREIEPYLDAIPCYASTMDEHAPNRIAATVRAALHIEQAR